jgi:hypothetical protein
MLTSFEAIRQVTVCPHGMRHAARGFSCCCCYWRPFVRCALQSCTGWYCAVVWLALAVLIARAIAQQPSSAVSS